VSADGSTRLATSDLCADDAISLGCALAAPGAPPELKTE